MIVMQYLVISQISQETTGQVEIKALSLVYRYALHLLFLNPEPFL